MDAAAKPPWMGSRRPRLTPPARPSPGNPLFAAIPSHEGAPPMAANRAPAPLFAGMPEYPNPGTMRSLTDYPVN